MHYIAERSVILPTTPPRPSTHTHTPGCVCVCYVAIMAKGVWSRASGRAPVVTTCEEGVEDGGSAPGRATVVTAGEEGDEYCVSVV